MSKKYLIKNPFNDIPNYSCFGCASANEHGLRMTFYEEGDYMISVWEPQYHFCGYNDILHGGIQATLCDEIASWTVYVKRNCSGVTSRLTMKYRKPVLVAKGNITLKSKITDIKRDKFVTIEVKLYDGEGELCAEGETIFWMFSKEESVEKYGFPEGGMERVESCP
ncbi:PaaI family thioesterase [Bacteroidales bacterium OttesenSCG-928-K03]|nr:PaaI family thioesterase [Odoribacter sp. OttesenSCG-928-L07]MDL2240432.1 PaaI family thioesterase [Bacteroidales bacterium OttesenSCG-928-K22]MDL2242989.1 PaaI family thioesterase [Bacteroidales bacterium OttesenSCG-928-K03]